MCNFLLIQWRTRTSPILTSFSLLMPSSRSFYACKKLETSAQNCLGLDPLPFMAKQTGLLEVIFKMTVKNVMGESFGCSPVAVHMSLFLLMKTILIAELTSSWTGCMCTQETCTRVTSWADFAHSFSTVLSWVREGGIGGSVPCSDHFATMSRTPTKSPWHSYSVFLHPVYHRSPKFGDISPISKALTRHADAIWIWWDIINIYMGLRNFLLRYFGGSQFIPLDWKSLPLCIV